MAKTKKDDYDESTAEIIEAYIETPLEEAPFEETYTPLDDPLEDLEDFSGLDEDSEDL
jgi:hypothetical protein